jgi:SAM-dependent methyltransferase
MVKRLADHGQDISTIDSILDFGCGSGRIARTFKAMCPHLRLYGTDIDPEAIGWCVSNIGDVGQFRRNDILPPLPFPDDSFDVAYTISTFTHMPEGLQLAWLAELRRVLKPGGHLLATVHGPAMVDHIANLYPGASDLRDELHASGFVYVGEARDGWPSYFGAWTDGLPSFYKLSYHSHRYIHDRWSEFFDILSVGCMDLNIFQDAIVARKPHGEKASYDQMLVLSLSEKAARGALDDAFRVTSHQNAEITKLNQRLAETDRALGEAQTLAYARLEEIEALTRRIAATDLALAEASRLAIERLDQVQNAERVASGVAR